MNENENIMRLLARLGGRQRRELMSRRENWREDGPDCPPPCGENRGPGHRGGEYGCEFHHGGPRGHMPPPPFGEPGCERPPFGEPRRGASLPPMARMRVLTALEQTGAISQRKLAMILAIRPQSLSEMLTKLADEGLVVREANADDRRETLVSLSAAGRERAAAAENERAEFAKSFLSPLDDGEKEQLATLLEKLLGDDGDEQQCNKE